MRIREVVFGTAAAVFCAASAASAHGEGPGHIYEGPSPGTWIVIIMVVSWIVIALGVVFFCPKIDTVGCFQKSKG
jgi:hypothetical protein